MKNIIFLIAIFIFPLTNTFGQGDPTGDCVSTIQGCKAELIDFAKDFLAQIPADCKYWNGACNTTEEIWRNGSVSLGTSKNYSTWNSTPFKLTVSGGIITEQLQICKAAWCDYVFDDTFQLRPLKSVSDFIQCNKHLPGCTPGPVIEQQNGIFLDEQTLEQQQKIEEAFLYLIGINERLDNILSANSINYDTNRKLLRDERSNTVLPIEAKVLALTVEGYEISPASSSTAADGLAGLKITGSTASSFNITWTQQGGGAIYHVFCDGDLIRIPNLKKGTYTFQIVESQPGGASTSCTVTITESASTICDEIGQRGRCRGELLSILSGEFEKQRPTCTQWGGDQCSNASPIFRTGNVCIGTSIGKSGFSLAVAGGIMTDKFRVELCSGNWCDYVFDENYKLMSLNNVKKHINEYHSLPGVVTQSEVTKEGGYELKSVKLEQQVKIEEAYLHLIQLQKKIETINQSLQEYN